MILVPFYEYEMVLFMWRDFINAEVVIVKRRQQWLAVLARLWKEQTMQ